MRKAFGVAFVLMFAGLAGCGGGGAPPRVVSTGPAIADQVAEAQLMAASHVVVTTTSTSTTSTTAPQPPPTTAAPRRTAPRPVSGQSVGHPVPVITAGPDDCSTPSRCPALRQCENGGSYAAGSSYPSYFGAYQFSQSTWSTASAHAQGGAYGSASAAQQDTAADWLYANADPTRQWPICHKHLARYR